MTIKTLIIAVLACWLFTPQSYATEEGILALKTDPKGATVYINDKLMLNSTPAVIELSPGNYNVRVKRQWLHAQTEIIIKPQAIVVKDLKLTPIIGATLVDSLKDGKACPYCPEMVIIPAGQFMIGNPDGRGIEKPVLEEHIQNPFAIGKYEVTFAEYDAFARATNKPLPDDNGWGRTNLPVINVNWYKATAYAEWLSEQTGEFYRLPTETEWEYVAKAGTQTDYWWGTEIGQGHANCATCESQWDETAPVGSFKPNPFGVYDMLGNVMEWTCSQYNYAYTGNHRRCGANRALGTRYGVRGNAWDSDGILRVTFRRGNPNGEKNVNLGFRLVRLNVSSNQCP